MADVKLKVDGREVSLSADITTIGRTPDNDLSFPNDANVSRNHAEIEFRDGEYCLIDLGSSNGTTVNGSRVYSEQYLASGDVILLGGTSRFEFVSGPVAEKKEVKPEGEVSAGDGPSGSADAPNLGTPSIPSVTAPDAQGAAAAGGSNLMLIVAGIVACVAILFVGIAAAVFFLSGSSSGGSGSGSSSTGGSKPWFGGIFGSSTCEAKAAITKPETGDTIAASTEIELDVQEGDCVAKAVFSVDGIEFASAEAPFSASIDPKEFPEFSDGVDHSLGVELVDEEGNPIGEQATVLLAFETRVVTKPKNDKPSGQPNTQPTGPVVPTTGKATLLEVQEMSKRLVQQFAGKREYNVSNKEFLTEVQKRTVEYAQEGYFDRAARYRDVINVAFVHEQNIDAPLGFLIAMSRSKFDPAKVGAEEGIFRMNTEFVTANAYNGQCGTETIADPLQNCASKAAALYMKSILFGVFDGDPIYGAAVFGKSPQDAGVWKATLPQNRVDLWNSIKTPQEREQLVRFFAAGIVGENPQKFGLKKDRPLSELYRLAM